MRRRIRSPRATPPTRTRWVCTPRSPPHASSTVASLRCSSRAWWPTCSRPSRSAGRIMFDPDYRNDGARRVCEYAGCVVLGEHDMANWRMALYALARTADDAPKPVGAQPSHRRPIQRPSRTGHAIRRGTARDCRAGTSVSRNVPRRRRSGPPRTTRPPASRPNATADAGCGREERHKRRPPR